jgi:DNA-binding NarL/FixJ family response regulator
MHNAPMAEPSVFRILVVDDFQPCRRFLCATLKTRPELQVIGEASDGFEAIQKAKDLKPDLILLDIGLPKLNGIEVAKSVSRLVPDGKILFISQNNDADVIATALSNGAKGYVWKQTAKADLLPAIEAVLQGDQFVSWQLVGTSISSL